LVRRKLRMQKQKPMPDLSPPAEDRLEGVDPAVTVAVMIQQAELLRIQAGMANPSSPDEVGPAIQDLSPLGR
jgi:hypothetical protein